MNIVKIQKFFICMTDMNIVTSTCLLAHPLYNHYTCIIHLLWFGAPDSSPRMRRRGGGGAVDENSLYISFHLKIYSEYLKSTMNCIYQNTCFYNVILKQYI